MAAAGQDHCKNATSEPAAPLNQSIPASPIDAFSRETAAQFHPDEINRLWQHGMHEERLFHDRLNYFSAVQTGLLGVYAILYNKEPSLGLFAPLTIVGLAFALLWLRVQMRHWRYCVHVNERIKASVSEYAQTIASSGRSDGLSIARPLAVAVPLLFASIWVALFAWVISLHGRR